MKSRLDLGIAVTMIVVGVITIVYPIINLMG